MNYFNKIKLAKKLPIIMICLTVVAIIASNFVSYKNASEALLVEAEEALATVAEARVLELEAWLSGVDMDLASQATNPTVLSAIRGFSEGWSAIPDIDKTGYLKKWYIENNPYEADNRLALDFAEDGSAYSQVHRVYHEYFRKLVEQKGYYDVLVFSPEGDLIYSVFKEEDFATNFLDGIYADTGLGTVVAQALNATEPTNFFGDFQKYAPSNDVPASFIAAPVIDRRGNVKGAVAFQIPIDRIDVITTRETGLGRTGDSYLIGDDLTLRSDRIHGHGHDVLETLMPNDSAKLSIAGKTGVIREVTKHPDTGETLEHIAAYLPVTHHNSYWGLIAEQTIEEILEPANALRNTMIWQGALMVLAVAVIALLLARTISRPLTSVENAMRKVSDGDYNSKVPGTDRADEIGGIANALDEFRTALGNAEQATSDGLFKGAAFEGSSAALMMLDRGFEVTYMNGAAGKLMMEHADTFSELHPSFDPEVIVGQSIDIFRSNSESLRDLLENIQKMPFKTDIKVSEVYFSLDINSVCDMDGEQIGCVIEWKDVTEIRTNEAIISALDTTQAKIEFDMSGALLASNSNFANMLGESPEELVGQMSHGLFQFDSDLENKNGSLWGRLQDGESVVGRFKLKNKQDDVAILDGTFSPVMDASGKPFRIILLGTDVTESQVALVESQEEQARMKAEQDKVVEGLRVGLEALADGDLTARIQNPFAPEYETLRSHFNKAIENLLDAMCSVVENADMIRGEASEISTAADDLSRRTEKQAATLEETATALDQLTSSVRSASEGANQASDMVETAKANAEASGKVVQEAVEAMGQIETSSNQISKITSVIDDIAFQTNLLALNAGVEAARAGEAGRGFAVVASEVRALAQRSSEAAREINDLISKSGTLVKRGVGLVDNTGEALRGIVTSVSEISNNVSEIAVSSREQSSGLAEINAAVNQLDQVTQQNAAMFEETTAASHSLTREAENLTVTTSRFSIGTTDKKQSNPPVNVEFPAKEAIKPKSVATTEKKTVNMNSNTVASMSDDDWEDF